MSTPIVIGVLLHLRTRIEPRAQAQWVKVFVSKGGRVQGPFWLENPLDDPMFLDETNIVSAEKTDARIVDAAHRSIAHIRDLLCYVVSPNEPPQSALGIFFVLEVYEQDDADEEGSEADVTGEEAADVAILNLWTFLGGDDDDDEHDEDEDEEEEEEDQVWFAQISLPYEGTTPLRDGALAILNIGFAIDGERRNHEISIYEDSFSCRTSDVYECDHCGTLHPVHFDDAHDESDLFASITAELRDEGGADYRAFLSNVAAQRCVDFLAWLELGLELTRARWHTESD